MTFNIDYKMIWEAFTLAASPVAAEGIFDSARTSLDKGYEVRINLGEGQQPLIFTRREDFDQWVQELTDRI